MPTLSTRAYAELMNLPAYEQVRILHEQKYPKADSGTFKMPYYSTALAGIRAYYKNGNNASSVKEALDKAAVLRGPGKRPNNARVLQSFLNGQMAARKLTNIALRANFYGNPHADVTIRLKFDLEGDESGRRKYIFINCRDVPLNPQVATDTLSIASWIFQENGLVVKQSDIEYYDLKTGSKFSIAKSSVKSVKKMMGNAAIITSLWPNV